MLSLIVIANSTIIKHFFEFFFLPHNRPWYEGAVWGNVVAVLPLTILAIAGFLWRKGVLIEAHQKIDKLAVTHDEHARHIKKILDLMDPEVEGGISSKLDEIKNELDPETDGGLKILLDRIEQL